VLPRRQGRQRRPRFTRRGYGRRCYRQAEQVAAREATFEGAFVGWFPGAHDLPHEAR
jgi:hypothetical protein